METDLRFPSSDRKGGASIVTQEFSENTSNEIAEWIRTVKFKRKIFGGVDEADVWNKIEELNNLYEKALRCERARYEALLKLLNIGRGGDIKHAK